MIEWYWTEKKERGNIKSLWKKTEQQWENYLFQKPGSLFWWHSDGFEPIKNFGSNVHFREKRMWAAISNHTQDHAPLRIGTHFVGRQTVSECKKKMNSLLWKSPQIISGRNFLFSFENLATVPQCSKIPTEPPSRLRKRGRHEGSSAGEGKTYERPHSYFQISEGEACDQGLGRCLSYSGG